VRPLIISVWGTDVLEAPHLTPFHRWLTRYALARADAITATGLHLATETTRYAPRGAPVTVVPYGVDLERFAPKPVRPELVEGRTGDEARHVVVGTVARLSPEKGVRYLVEAFATLKRRYGDGVSLSIAGEGPERDRLAALAARLGIGVDWRGWLQHNDVPAFLQGLDIFVLPSVYEGFGIAAVEAAASGLPVVASDVHGIPDVVSDGETGLLVPAKDASALAQAITRLVEDDALRRRLGEAGRRYVAQRYDWRANTAQMELIYESVLKGRTASAA
jgi:glycosyltransferase involved in cell wall biosynthesis